MLEDLLNNLPHYRLTHTLSTPSPISSISFGHSNHIFAGSGALRGRDSSPAQTREFIDDGSLRVYDLSSFKVCRAVSGLPTEISSVCCFKRPGSDLRDVWLACGRYVSPTFVVQDLFWSHSKTIVSRPIRFKWTPKNWYRRPLTLLRSSSCATTKIF